MSHIYLFQTAIVTAAQKHTASTKCISFEFWRPFWDIVVPSVIFSCHSAEKLFRERRISVFLQSKFPSHFDQKSPQTKSITRKLKNLVKNSENFLKLKQILQKHKQNSLTIQFIGKFTLLSCSQNVEKTPALACTSIKNSLAQDMIIYDNLTRHQAPF